MIVIYISVHLYKISYTDDYRTFLTEYSWGVSLMLSHYSRSYCNYLYNYLFAQGPEVRKRRGDTRKIFFFTCSRVALHVLTWNSTRAHVKPYTCSRETLHVLTWNPTRAHVKPYTCSRVVLHVLTWSPIRAHVKSYTCSRGNVYVLTWSPIRAHVKPYTCSRETLHVLTWSIDQSKQVSHLAYQRFEMKI